MLKSTALILGLFAAFASLSLLPAMAQDTTATPANATNLDGIKTYLLGKCTDLSNGATDLAATAQAYYDLAKAANFDYAALWKNSAKDVTDILDKARTQWIYISPIYEQMEGIVAGTPSLTNFDAILDAGPSAQEDPQNAPDFDVPLPNGQTLSKPGNLFGVLEGTLWGTRKEFITDVQADLDGDGKVGFGDVIPDANDLKGAADAMASYTVQLLTAAGEWQPTETDAFSALVANIPTVSDFFETWKDSRFVMGDKATRTDFVVISRLSDIKDNVSSWEVIYDGLSPLVAVVDPDQNDQINSQLNDLKSYVLDLYTQEHGGRHFTPEEADFYSAEAQDRAMTITGEITQAAALLDIQLPQ